MLWIKAFHIIAVVAWFAGLFYLPRLFVYHAMAEDQISIDRFRTMERKLYRGIMSPSAIVAVVLGLWLMVLQWSAIRDAGWLWVKLAMVLALVVFHLWCGRQLAAFATGKPNHSHVLYRVANEFPIIPLTVIVIMVVVRPF